MPGGHDAAALWQDLVGASVMRPGDFLVQLAAADEGRVFFLYDTIDRLDDAHRRFALAAPEPDPARRRERVRALRATFALADPWWDAARLPFSRPVADAPRVLQTARVSADGVLAPPNRQLLWTTAFDDQIEATPEWRARLAQSAPADAAWLVERIATAESNQGRSRLGMLAFAQRVFGDAEADAGDLLAALRGFGRYRALALTLERIGLRDPALYAAASRHAERIEAAGHGDRGRVTLAQFQGALALLDRAVAAGSLDADAAGALVRSLSGVTIVDGRYDERLADWIDRELRPGLRTRLGLPAAARAEAVVLRALAGPARASAATRLQWEGLAYDVDPADAEYRRLRAIRERQGGSTLDEALAASGAPRESRLASALTDLAYAAALGPAEGAPAASEDVARRHDFGFEEPQTLGGPRPEWTVPREVAGPGQRWHAQGALLGLDVALARLALRRLDTEVPPVPLLSAADRRAFAEGAVLVRGAALDDATRDRIARGLAARPRAAGGGGRGSRRPRARHRRPPAARLAARGLALDCGARPRALRVGLHAGRGACGSGAEARPRAPAPGAPARAGTTAASARACGRPAPLDELAGRTADGRLAALAPDLHLRVAELLAEMKLARAPPPRPLEPGRAGPDGRSGAGLSRRRPGHRALRPRPHAHADGGLRGRARWARSARSRSPSHEHARSGRSRGRGGGRLRPRPAGAARSAQRRAGERRRRTSASSRPPPTSASRASSPCARRWEPDIAARVARVSFRADGEALCARERPPYECEWDAGGRAVVHVVRAVAELSDGAPAHRHACARRARPAPRAPPPASPWPPTSTWCRSSRSSPTARAAS